MPCLSAERTLDEQVAALERTPKAIVFADVTDSVRLAETDEDLAIRRWLDFTRRLNDDVLPEFSGRLVKSLGDGVLLEFDDPGNAVLAGFKMLRQMEALNSGTPRDERMSIRLGIDLGEVIRTDGDVYGRHVNIAARLLGLAQPGEIVATADVRDHLASQIDAEFEDIGANYLRNIAQPVQTFRVRPRGAVRRIMPLLRQEDLLPTVAVIPFTPRNRSRDNFSLGEILAEDIIVNLSQSAELNVISRLSTTGFRMRSTPLSEIGAVLNANFVLSGTYSGDADRIILDMELADVRTARVVWAGRLSEEVATLIGEPSAVEEVVAQVLRAIRATEVRRAMANPMPTLQGHSLLIAAVALMHRLSPRDFQFARELLETLIERSPNLPSPRAWMARWHVLRVQQGWAESPRREGDLALQNTRRALDIDPTNVPALVAEGSVLTSLMHRLDDALDRYNGALDTNPNDATGRLLRGTLRAFRGEGEAAVGDTERALHLAPLDPNRYYFLSLAASACIAAGDNSRALELAESSLRSNRAHTSTLRVKAVAQLRLGDGEGARATVGQLLQLQPGMTVSNWLEGSPSGRYAVGRAFAESLAEAGVPA